MDFLRPFRRKKEDFALQAVVDGASGPLPCADANTISREGLETLIEAVMNKKRAFGGNDPTVAQNCGTFLKKLLNAPDSPGAGSRMSADALAGEFATLFAELKQDAHHYRVLGEVALPDSPKPATALTVSDLFISKATVFVSAMDALCRIGGFGDTLKANLTEMHITPEQLMQQQR